MVFVCHATVKIVNYHLADVSQGKTPLSAQFHYAYAPVNISGETIFHIIIWCFLGKVCPRVKRLMTNQHAPLERAPCESLWRAQPAMTQKMPIRGHDVGVSIQHTGQLLAIAYRGHYRFQCLSIREYIAGVQKNNVIASGKPYALVHGIVKSLVLFRNHCHIMAIVRLVGTQFVVHGHLHRFVFRQAIKNKMLNVGIFLAQDAIESSLQHRSRIIRTSDYRKLNHVNASCYNL